MIEHGNLSGRQGPSPSRQHLALPAHLSLATASQSPDNPIGLCQKLTADIISHPGSIRPAYGDTIDGSADLTANSRTPVIDVATLYNPAFKAVNGRGQIETWILTDTRLVRLYGADAFLFSDYGIVATPLRLSSHSWGLLVHFGDGDTWELAWNYAFSRWAFAPMIPPNMAGKLRTDLTDITAFASGDHAGGKVQFNLGYTRLSDSALTLANLKQSIYYDNEVSGITKVFWDDLVGEIDRRMDFKSGTIDTVALIGWLKGIIAKYGLDVNGWAATYLGTYPINKNTDDTLNSNVNDRLHESQDIDGVYWRDHWVNNYGFGQEFAATFTAPIDAVYGSDGNGKDRDWHALACWLIGVTMFIDPDSSYRIQFKDYKRDEWPTRRDELDICLSYIHGDETLRDHFAGQYYGTETMPVPFKDTVIAYGKLRADNKVNETITSNLGSIRVAYSWILRDGYLPPVVSYLSVDDARYGRGGWLSVDLTDLPANVEGILAWISFNTSGLWEPWQQVARFEFMDLAKDAGAYQVALDTYRLAAETDTGYTDQTGKRLTSRKTGNVWCLPVLFEKMDTLTFPQLSGYDGDILTGFGYILNLDSVAIAADVRSAYYNGGGALFWTATGSDGVGMDTIFPITNMAAIPELGGVTIYGIAQVSRYVVVVTSKGYSVFQFGQALRHVRTIHGFAPVHQYAWATDGMRIVSLSRDGLYSVQPDGQTDPLHREVDWPGMADQDSYLLYDSVNNELCLYHASLVTVVSPQNGVVYQRNYGSASPVLRHFYNGQKLCVTDGQAVYVYDRTYSGNSEIHTNPVWMGDPTSPKRIRDLWITFECGHSGTISPFQLIIEGENGTILNTNITVEGYQPWKPVSIRAILHRVAQVQVDNAVSRWKLTTIGTTGQSWELRIDANNAPTRWFTIRLLPAAGYSDLVIYRIDIGYTTLSPR